MDRAAERIADLIVDACVLTARRGLDPVRDEACIRTLACLREELALLALATTDTAAADDACGVVGEIDDALRRVGAAELLDAAV